MKAQMNVTPIVPVLLFMVLYAFAPVAIHYAPNNILVIWNENQYLFGFAFGVVTSIFMFWALSYMPAVAIIQEKVNKL